MIDLTPWLRCADGDRSRGRRSRGRSASRRRSRRRSMCWTAPWITCRAWRDRPWTWRPRPPCPTPEVRYLFGWLVGWLRGWIVDCVLDLGLGLLSLEIFLIRFFLVFLGRRKTNRPTRSFPADEGTLWKTRPISATGRSEAWGRLISQSAEVGC